MNATGVKILIIDDDPDFIRSAGMVLKSAGYQVVEALSGKEGLEKSNSHKPDLYIIDLMMESYSEGANVIRALVNDEETKNKPRIMITSVDLTGPWSTYSQDRELACDFCLQKPVAPAELLEYVHRALERK